MPPSPWRVAGRGSWNRANSDHVLDATAEVRSGLVLRLDLPVNFFNPPLFYRAEFEHRVRVNDEDTARDDVVDNWNTQCSTHWDGLRHVNEPAGYFGGRSDAELGAEHLADPGLVTRAVLADVARWRAGQGRPIDPRTSATISADDLEGTLAAQGSELRSGDVLLVRTGWVNWYRTASSEERAAAADRTRLRTPGLLATQATADWLDRHALAAVAADTPSVEAWPLGAGADGAGESLHVLAMVRRGLIFGELWDLDQLAEHCAEEHRWESMLVSAPLAFVGACAAPANALVIR